MDRGRDGARPLEDLRAFEVEAGVLFELDEEEHDLSREGCLVRLEIVEVGPRDGLQDEKKSLPPEVRAELCGRLAAAGVPRVEAARFLNSKRASQMAGAEEGMGGLNRDWVTA